MKKYLFVCEHNFTRSRHGAEFFRGYLKGKGVSARVDSAGIGFISLILGRKVNKKMIKKYDFIFVMEKWMKDYLVEKMDVDEKKIFSLSIKDDYGFLRGKSIGDLDKEFEKVNWKNWI